MYLVVLWIDDRGGFETTSRSCLKIVFWYKGKAAANINPEEYIRYFEDLI